MKLFKQIAHAAGLTGLVTFSGAITCATADNTSYIEPGAYEANTLVVPELADTESQTDLGSESSTSTNQPHKTSVPLPAAVWLFGSAVIGLTVVARRRK